MMDETTTGAPLVPFADGLTGRDAAGRFVRGNAGGPGNPHGGTVARLRSVLLDEVTDDDLRAVVRALVEAAKAGNIPAAREVLDRTLGRVAVPTADVDADALAPRVVRYIIE